MSLAYDGTMGPPLKDVLSKTLISMLDASQEIRYLDCDLMSCINMAAYAREHPDRAINCGIAEANMIGIAAGLAASGFRPICHTFGPFASRRCYDQAYLSGGYAGNDITILGTDPGVCAAFNGGTHMPFEDVALYRALPGATVIDITDAVMLEHILNPVLARPGVKYLRLGRKSCPNVYTPDTLFEIGRGNVLREGEHATILACGIMVAKALQAAWLLEEEGISARVVDLYTIKPLDRDLVLRCARETPVLVTAENHNKIGGLYSAVAETLGQSSRKLGYVAVEDRFGEVGPQDYLERRFGLTAQHIADVVKQTL